MKKSHIILLSIILFPSLLYLFFEMTQANFKKMAYYGPKTVNEKGDTVYYSVPDKGFSNNMKIIEQTTPYNEGAETKETTFQISMGDSLLSIDTTNYPIYIILFLNDSLKKDGYKLTGIYDYVQYKPAELKNIPIFFVSRFSSIKTDVANENKIQRGTCDSLKIKLPSNIHLVCDLYVNEEYYFKNKPYYVFNYFAVLVDKQRHIRGYYDPNQNSEIKRMIQEFKHLKTKDEYANTLKQNELEKK